MYNRYIRNDRGVYTRMPEADEPPAASTARSEGNSPTTSSQPQKAAEIPPNGFIPQTLSDGGDGLSRTVRRLLDRFHLDNVDTGDLLLLLLLFLLFKEDADEELLFALGLLLIL